MTHILRNFSLTDGQQKAIKYIQEFLSKPVIPEDVSTYMCTLEGPAGTGKTTITKAVIVLARKTGKQVLCVAPTHKARKVLHSVINTSTFLKIPTTTVAGLLGKSRAHGYIGTQNYKREMETQIGMYDFFIVDEISMVTTEDYKDIAGLAREFHKKVLFVGDELQIPNPAQHYLECKDHDGNLYLVKPSNPAFKEIPCLQLTEIIRQQGTNNPLVDLLTRVRQASCASGCGSGSSSSGDAWNIYDLATGGSLVSRDSDSGSGGQVGYLLLDQEAFINQIRKSASLFPIGLTRIIAYTNKSVQQYNSLVRTSLGYTEPIVVGELLMGYNNVGPRGDPTIENGQDYMVKAVTHTERHSVAANGKSYVNLVGDIVTMVPFNTGGQTSSQPPVAVAIFVPDLSDPNNNEVLEELVYLALKVNRLGSTKSDYRNYMGLKSQLVFMENLYRRNDNIYTESEFKQLHPLLFTKTTAVLSPKGELLTSELSHRINGAYPSLLRSRVNDEGKEISLCETLADMYQILERDINYGYALTAHKSQGSTYHTVLVDEPDFNSLSDRWSHKHHCEIRCGPERNQLRYVAMSRPTNVCYIMTTSTGKND